MTEPRPAPIDPRLWEASRAGARSGRGFRFQDAVGAWLGLQIWAGKLDADTLVPEGLDDITLHKGEEEFRVQVKARHDPRGTFCSTEIVQHLVKAVGTVDENALGQRKDGLLQKQITSQADASRLAVGKRAPTIQSGNAC